MDLSKRFWGRWYKADELKRVQIVKELEIEKPAIDPHSIATIVNSYFCDLADYLKSEHRKAIK